MKLTVHFEVDVEIPDAYPSVDAMPKADADQLIEDAISRWLRYMDGRERGRDVRVVIRRQVKVS